MGGTLQPKDVCNGIKLSEANGQPDDQACAEEGSGGGLTRRDADFPFPVLPGSLLRLPASLLPCLPLHPASFPVFLLFCFGSSGD